MTGLLVVGAVVGAAVALNFPRIRFTVHVIGEDGEPIPGVQTSYNFNQDSSTEDKIIQVTEVTDSNGNFTTEGYSRYGIVAGQPLIKDGYYPGTPGLPPFRGVKDGHWQPWDGTYTTVLRKIENPIPMYAKVYNVDIPIIGQPCGYDLEVGDWIGPYGKGRVADFIFTLQRQYQNYFNFDVSVALTFPNSGDGIQVTELPKEFDNSMFKWPRLAPEDGYQPTMTLRFAETGGTPTQNNVTQGEVYFFRVRTVEQNGKIVSALYGKINAGLGLSPGHSKTCKIQLYYYLNPTPNDRNMEYGGTLFKNLSEFDVPRAP